MNQQQLNCPDCGTAIPYDTYGLLQGRQFACSKCGLAIGLAPQSHDQVKNAMEEYENLKASLGQQKGDKATQGTR